MLKKIIFYLAAILISLVAAHHRWGDSGHSMGLLSVSGGSVRHPAIFSSGKRQYSQVITATVLPPYKGNTRIVLEGPSAVDHDIYFQSPLIDMGIGSNPRFQGDTLFNLAPGDRLTLWLLIRTKIDKPINGKYDLVFYDTASEKQVLKVPFIFKKDDSHNESKSQH